MKRKLLIALVCAVVLTGVLLAACPTSAKAEGSGEAGTVITADPKGGLVIACGSGAVRILEIQAPGGKRMKPEDYLRGHSIAVGTDLKEDRT